MNELNPYDTSLAALLQGAETWPGLIPLLLGATPQPITPDNLNPFSTGGIGGMVPGGISKFVPLYRGEVRPYENLWKPESILNRFTGSWYTPNEEIARGFADAGGGGFENFLLKLQIPEHMLSRFSVNRLSPELRYKLVDAPSEQAHIIPEWLRSISERIR